MLRAEETAFLHELLHAGGSDLSDKALHDRPPPPRRLGPIVLKQLLVRELSGANGFFTEVFAKCGSQSSFITDSIVGRAIAVALTDCGKHRRD